MKMSEVFEDEITYEWTPTSENSAYEIYNGNKIIADCWFEKEAEAIVEAIKQHDRLVAENEALKAALEKMVFLFESVQPKPIERPAWLNELLATVNNN